MNRLIFITQFFTLSILYAECSDLTYEECIYWSGYCEWNEESGQCQDAGGGGPSRWKRGPPRGGPAEAAAAGPARLRQRGQGVGADGAGGAPGAELLAAEVPVGAVPGGLPAELRLGGGVRGARGHVQGQGVLSVLPDGHLPLAPPGLPRGEPGRPPLDLPRR